MSGQDNPPYALPGPGDILRVELDNGLIVLARENFTSPAVVVSGVLRGGALQESRQKAGLASFHASLLTRGTLRHTFTDLYEEIESNGASLDVSSSGHTYRFGTKSLAEDLPRMLGLLGEVLREPTFPEEHVERVRGQMITGLQFRAHDTRSMASLAFYELAYPDSHPYAKSGEGYLDTVSALSREDVVRFQQNLGPRGGIVVVVGAVKAEEAVEQVREIFGDWENPAQPEIPLAPPAPALTEIRERFVPIPGKSQSDIMLGYPGPRRSAPDYQAARMANSILGVFGLYGRLGDTVREQQGLAYYSFSRLAGGLGPGPWRVSAGVAPQNVERAVESIRVEIRRIVEEPVLPEELADNQSFFKGQLLLGLETNEGVAGSILSMELNQLGLDYLLNYAEMIDAITIADVQAAARAYLNPDAYALAVAGPEQA
jgi:zinc protease